MFFPSIFASVFDDPFDLPERIAFPAIPSRNRAEEDGRNTCTMRADVRKFDDRYEVDIDLPGYTKDEIQISLSEGELTVRAEKNQERTEEEEGRIIRRERYTGTMQRTLSVGDLVTEEDIKAKFADGVLTLVVPQKEPPVPEKKYIAIEG